MHMRNLRKITLTHDNSTDSNPRPQQQIMTPAMHGYNYSTYHPQQHTTVSPWVECDVSPLATFQLPPTYPTIIMTTMEINSHLLTTRQQHSYHPTQQANTIPFTPTAVYPILMSGVVAQHTMHYHLMDDKRPIFYCTMY